MNKEDYDHVVVYGYDIVQIAKEKNLTVLQWQKFLFEEYIMAADLRTKVSKGISVLAMQGASERMPAKIVQLSIMKHYFKKDGTKDQWYTFLGSLMLSDIEMVFSEIEKLGLKIFTNEELELVSKTPRNMAKIQKILKKRIF